MRELRVCPNCGAYVITDRNICPRCDAPLDEPSPEATASDTDLEDPVADVLAEIEAAQADEDEPAETAPWLPEIEPAPESGEGGETAPGEEGTPSEPLAVREERPTMPGWLPEATLPAIHKEPEAPLDPHDRPTSPNLDVSGGRRSRGFEADVTIPRLPEDVEEELAGSPSDEPTMQFDRGLGAPPEADVTSPYRPQEPIAAPPASALRPPLQGWMPYPAGGAQNYWDAATRFFQQRIQGYLDAGYQAHVHSAQEATLSYGKPLGVGGWVLAILTIIGLLWYIAIQAFSGFRRDMVYLTLEPDGRVYEDGPGAAHIRRERSRSGRRWSLVGLTILVLSLVLAIVLGVIAGLWMQDDQRRSALGEIDLLGLPITEFLDLESDVDVSEAAIEQAETAAVVASVLAALAVLGIWGGATLLIIGTIHALAYRTRVPPLSGFA